MTWPAFLFGFLIATLYGALFHLIVGGNALRLSFYLLLAWVGFWSGQGLGSFLPFSLVSLGAIHLDFATLGAIAILCLGHWLSKFETGRNRSR
ncbi:MAG: hypothetical protein AB1345_06085 [Chloroflexota bacterium]